MTVISASNNSSGYQQGFSQDVAFYNLRTFTTLVTCHYPLSHFVWFPLFLHSRDTDFSQVHIYAEWGLQNFSSILPRPRQRSRNRNTLTPTFFRIPNAICIIQSLEVKIFAQEQIIRDSCHPRYMGQVRKAVGIRWYNLLEFAGVIYRNCCMM